VVKALKENPALSAVSINRQRQTISIATLDQTKFPELEIRISDTLNKASLTHQERQCTLVQGLGACRTCLRPLSEEEQKAVTITHETARTTIARVTCPTAPRFWRWKDLPIPKVVPRVIELPEKEEDVDEWKWQLLAAGLCAGFGIAGFLLKGGSWSVAAYVAAYASGAWFAIHEAWEKLRERAIDVHFLMLAVAAGSAAIGAWGEGAMLLFLFSLSGALEHYAFGRTQREIRSLFKQAPKSATVLDAGGREREEPVANLVPGMRLLLKPGSQFPVDAEIVKGQTAADESTLTGESVPVEKKTGDIVLSGTMNLWGAVEAVVLHAARESALEKIIHLIREAQQQKAPSQQFTDKFGAVYTYAALGASFLMFFVWWLGLGHAPFHSDAHGPSAFYRAMTLLVVASPCALVLSIPSAVLAAIAWGARHGILFRGGAAVEKLAGVTTVALDKTGTLTTGELRVEKVQSFPPGHEAEIASIAFSLEKLSTHPLARAITRYGKQQALPELAVEQFESVTGLGLTAVFEGQLCCLGRSAWVRGQTSQPWPDQSDAGQPGLSEVWVARGPLLGRLILRDDIRPESRRVIDELSKAGLETVVLTGDRAESARQLGTLLGIRDVRSELKPEDKLRMIRDLSGAGHRTAMIGDGINDAPSLAAADIGVAMGARGADAALEQADIVLMHDRLENFLAAFRLSKRARSVIRLNLLISLGTVVVLVVFAMAGRIPLTLGVLGHEGSTVLVVMNSLRLLFHKN
jgi:Cd2+/Zn2+-exporting ATPase